MNDKQTQAIAQRDDRPKTISFMVAGNEVKLGTKVVRDLLVRGDQSKVKDQEIWQFIKLCQHQKLDPFVNDAYLVKFGQDAQLITSKGAFMKRAEVHAEYDGFEAGLTLEDGEGVPVQRSGAFIPSGMKLAGAWARVFRSDRKVPFYVEIMFKEYDKGRSTWRDIPATMVRKVAIVHAMREAFPAQLADLYTEDELLASGAFERKRSVVVDATSRIDNILAEKAEPTVIDADEPPVEKPANKVDLHTVRPAKSKAKKLPDVIAQATARFGPDHIAAVHKALGITIDESMAGQLDLVGRSTAMHAWEQALSYDSVPPAHGTDDFDAYVETLRTMED